MRNWKVLTQKERDVIWDYIFDNFQFAPNYDDRKLVTFLCEHRCFDISKHYDAGFTEEVYGDLHRSAIECFKTIAKGKKIYAMNWQHECYSFSPQLPSEINEFGEWFISVFPNGDYIFFLSEDFKNGIFGDGLEFSLCYFGKVILSCISKDPPLIIRS